MGVGLAILFTLLHYAHVIPDTPYDWLIMFALLLFISEGCNHGRSN